MLLRQHLPNLAPHSHQLLLKSSQLYLHHQLLFLARLLLFLPWVFVSLLLNHANDAALPFELGVDLLDLDLVVDLGQNQRGLVG